MEYAIELSRDMITDIGLPYSICQKPLWITFGDGGSRESSFSYFVEETPLGTAGSVKNAENFLDRDFPGHQRMC